MKPSALTEMPNSRSRSGSTGGIALLDCLVYLALFSLIAGLAFAAFFEANDNSKHLTRNAADIVRALQAGEKWRADVRAATSAPRSIKTEDESGLLLPQSGGEVRYLFRQGTVYRQSAADAKPLPLLPAVKSSLMLPDVRTHVTAWRWEVELATAQKAARVPPLFTFTAVPK